MLLPPVIRCFQLCENVRADPTKPQRVSLDGLLAAIRSIDVPAYPLIFPEICAYIQMTECTGTGRFRVQIHHPDTGTIVFQTRSYRGDFGTDPLVVHGMSFRLKNYRFRERGLYEFEFCYNGAVEAESFLILR